MLDSVVHPELYTPMHHRKAWCLKHVWTRTSSLTHAICTTHTRLTTHTHTPNAASKQQKVYEVLLSSQVFPSCNKTPVSLVGSWIIKYIMTHNSYCSQPTNNESTNWSVPLYPGIGVDLRWPYLTMTTFANFDLKCDQSDLFFQPSPRTPPSDLWVSGMAKKHKTIKQPLSFITSHSEPFPTAINHH